MTRRALLLSPLAAVACEGGAAATSFGGGWVGAGHERGHRVLTATTIPTPATLQRCSVAIVGAGVAGLAAARALRRAGVDDLRIFELEDDDELEEVLTPDGPEGEFLRRLDEHEVVPLEEDEATEI